MKTLHLAIATAIGTVSLVSFGIYIISNPIILQYSLSQDCQIPNLNEIPVDFIVKLPTKLPTGYTLQGIVINGREQVMIFYADHSLCNSPRNGFNTNDAQLRIVITKSDVQENSTTYQNNWFKSSSDPESNNYGKFQRIQVNGYKGIGWEQYNAVPTSLFFLNDGSQIQYSLFGLDNQSLDQLLEIARSIPIGMNQSLENKLGLTGPPRSSLQQLDLARIGVENNQAVKVVNTNFTINYHLTGDNNLVNAALDKKHALVLSLVTSGNGTLTVSVPRALLDPKNAYNNEGAQFIILINGQEVKYTETTSIITRNLTIPFESGATKIEIIAPQSI